MLTDRAKLLLAYAAAEYMSLADAFNALADEGAVVRALAMTCQSRADGLSWRWAWEMGLVPQDTALLDPHERMLAVRQCLSENVQELEEVLGPVKQRLG